MKSYYPLKRVRCGRVLITLIVPMLLFISAHVKAAAECRLDTEQESAVAKEDVNKLLASLPDGYYVSLNGIRPSIKFSSAHFEGMKELNDSLEDSLEDVQEIAKGLGIDIGQYKLRLTFNPSATARELEYFVGPIKTEDFLTYCQGQGLQEEAEETEVGGYKLWFGENGMACALFHDGGLLGSKEVIEKLLQPRSQESPSVLDGEQFRQVISLVDFDAAEFGLRYGEKERTAMSLQQFVRTVDAPEEILEASKSLEALGYSYHWGDRFRASVRLLFDDGEAAETIRAFFSDNLAEIVEAIAPDMLSSSLRGRELVTKEITTLVDNVSISKQGQILDISVQVGVEELKKFVLSFNCAAAIEIPLDQPFEAKLAGTEPVVFKFSAEKAGYYQIFALGPFETRGTLLDGNCKEIAEDEYSGENDNFKIIKHLIAGAHFVGVRGFDDDETGPFTIRVEPVHPLGGDDCGSAEEIEIEGEITGALIGEIPRYFRFDVKEPGPYVVYSEGELDTFGSLMDTFCQELENNDDAEEDVNFAIERKLAPGTYYVSVKGVEENESGEIALKVGRALPATSKCENAQPLKINEKVTIKSVGEKPVYYSFEITEPSNCSIYTTGEADTFATLLDGFCQEIVTVDDIEAENGEEEDSNFRIERKLAPGTYYLAVGDYDEEEDLPIVLMVEIVRL